MAGSLRLLSTRWSAVRILALLVVAVGLWATGSQLITLVKQVDGVVAATPNPVVENEQRRHAALLENQVKDYPANLGALLAFSGFILVVTVHFAAVVWRVFPKLPLTSLVAGLFLAASGICGLLVLPSVAKVNEFAFQAVGAATGEREWLRGGMAFLNQIHLVFVSGWLMFLALGWLALGVGLVRLPGHLRAWGILVLAGSIGIVVSLATRYWLPTYGSTAPGAALVLSGEVFPLGIGLGLTGTGLVSFLLEGDGAEPAKGALSTEGEA
ncbi:MAG TPA: hypothetical protein VJ820_19755 [Propionibacteriaceae bacterium]|nr:hypothetical protein [Propionibacteriaceae bacterium]